MKRTTIIICAVGALGLLHYGLNQNKQPRSLISSSQTSANQTATQQPPAGSTTAVYKDGTYNGNAEDNPYGTVQIAVVISGGKITNVNFLQMPTGTGHTDEVTRVAGPLLKQTTLQKQSSNIDFVSGATSTSESYKLSLQSALDKAANSASSSSSSNSSGGTSGTGTSPGTGSGSTPIYSRPNHVSGSGEGE